MATYLIKRGADVNAVDEKNVSACLIACATGTPPSPDACTCMWMVLTVMLARLRQGNLCLLTQAPSAC